MLRLPFGAPMTGHSKLPPSSAARRVMCPGSRYMESLYPREQTEQSKEGELAHQVCADLLNGANICKGEGVEDKMLQDCKMYSNYVLNLYEYPALLHVEKKIDLSMIHKDCWGTADAWFVVDKTLHMFDFKYGFRPVEVYENWQMIEYAAGVIEEYEKAVFHIVQPRAPHVDGPIRTWEVHIFELVDYWDMLERVEHEAAQDKAPLRTSSACVNCMARHACTILQKTVLNQLDAMTYREPTNLTDEQLGNELRLLQNTQMLMDARITGLEEEALAKLKAGNRIPHYELGEVQSREKWTCDPSQLGELFGVEVRKPVEVEFITPKQAIKAGIPAKVVRQYSDTPKGAKKLQAIDEKKIRKIFS